GGRARRGGEGRPLHARALGRRRLPGPPRGRAGPVRLEADRDLRCLRRDDRAAAVHAGAHAAGGARRADAPRGNAVRPEPRRALCRARPPGFVAGRRRAVAQRRRRLTTSLFLVELVEEPTLGRAWLETSRRILAHGPDATYDGAATKELVLVTVAVAEPDPEDELIAALADPGWLDWMRRNFIEPDDVPELGGARSYARRLRDYDGRDQVAWVIERLADPECRSAAITTFEPHTDTTYVPCISLLDFWRVSGSLDLVVYAHSLDFGKKAYGNLVELARL